MLIGKGLLLLHLPVLMVLNIGIKGVEGDAIVGLVFHAELIKWTGVLLLHEIVLLLDEVVHDLLVMRIILPLLLLLLLAEVVLLVLVLELLYQ